MIVSMLLLTFLSCMNSSQKGQRMKPIMFGGVEFLDTVHHLGDIPFEEPVRSFDFKFVNHSKRLLVILDAKPSCRCTKVEYPMKPVSTGDTSYIRVTYDGTGRSPEYFNKSVTVYTNVADNLIELKIKGVLKR